MPHLYLHVPFCRRRCSYCDFAIAVRKRVPAAEYVEAIRRELALVFSGGGADPGAPPRAEPQLGGSPLDTVYLGGGTPSLLPPDAVAALLEAVFRAAPAAAAVEVTLEANPEDVTSAAAAAWRAAGVNRVSLGAQSFDDRVLQWMRRPHDAARIARAVRELRAAGFANVSLDLIFAVPEELDRDWGRDLDRAVALAPEHLSLYGLTVEPRTPLARWVSRGATHPPSDDRYAEEYLLAHARLDAAGYRFYEVSNAARAAAGPDGRSRHNSAYWSGRPYLGLGPAAHSFDGRARRWNLDAWEAYRRALAAGQAPVAAEEVLTEEQRALERLYLELRSAVGIRLTAIPPDRLTAWVGAGWAVVVGDRARCTPEGWLRLDALVADLTGPPAVA